MTAYLCEVALDIGPSHIYMRGTVTVPAGQTAEQVRESVVAEIAAGHPGQTATVTTWSLTEVTR